MERYGLKRAGFQKNWEIEWEPVIVTGKRYSMIFTRRAISLTTTAINQMEPENKKENRLTLQIQSLRSGNRSAILTTLKELRSDGDISILPDLFDLLLDQEDEQITGEISSMLNDLKDKEAVPILSEAIGNPDYSEILTILVSACWQNGLSYGKYINTFTEVVISGEYDAAIEAFTVIEEAVGDLEQEEKNQLVINLKSRIKDTVIRVLKVICA